MMKRTLKMAAALAMAMLMLFALAACGDTSEDPAPAGNTPTPTPGGVTEATPTPGDSGNPPADGAKKVGISMPTKSLQRWNQDGDNMKKAFEAAGYVVDLQYGGENEVAMQINQIENMIAGGCDVLVIAAIEGDSMTEVLADAKAKGIPVIAHDRLIMNTDAVTYYATFDNWLVGVMQGEYIEKNLDLKNAEGPFNIEFFTGDPGDNNINFFFDGAMSVLQPYLDSGKLVCLSGQTEKSVVATPEWKTENAQSRMENLISSNNYSPDGTKLDAVMCSNDSTAQGATNALVNAGFTADNFPIITGQDCDRTSVKNMIAGTQSMSVFKDTRTLADKVVEMVDAVLKGATPSINDTETYDNGTGVIPSFLCEPVFGDINNYKALLIDSGYYTEDELK